MNNIFVSWKQKIESRIISDLKSQYGIVDIEELANRIVCKLEERQIVIKESGLKAEMKATNSIEKSGEEDIYKKALSFIDTL